jgi:2-hydroxy-6-oxonona-2,4-dienedioate hydrolase
LGTLFHKELVTEDLVRERHEMSIGKNQEAARLRRGVKPPRSVLEELLNLKAKTLLLWGVQDRGVSVERGLLLFQLIPNAEFHLFDHCGHWVQWDQAERFNRLVADFLRDGD